MRAKKEKIPPIIRIRALNSFYMDINEIGHLEYKPVGHVFQYQREGSEEWFPFDVDLQVVENPLSNTEET
jgi:hypothetical protein